MTRESIIAGNYVSFVVDDTLNGRACADPHAIVRDTKHFKYASVLVGWQCGFEPLFVAVHSYLDCELSDEEAEELATNYLNERGWFSDEAKECDYLVR